MKLCLIAPAPPPCGGIANWTKIVCKQIEKEQENIDFSFINIAPTVSYIERKGVLRHIWTSFWELLVQRRKLLYQVKLNRPDVIHLTTSGRLSFIRDYVLMRVMRKHNIPCIYHLHFGRIPQIVANQSIEYRLFMKTLSKACKVIAIDPKTFECLRKEFPNVESVYIPNPVEKNEILQKSLEMKKEILFVGWVIKEKGIEELICAWSCIQQNFPDYTLHFIGPYNNEYKKYLYDTYNMKNVVMEGELSHEETLQRIHECTAMVLPSYSEGFPNVILEAMMARKAIVATNVGAIPEMLSGEAGILIEPKNATQIERVLVELLHDQSHRNKLAGNAYQRVVGLYQTDIIFEQYFKIWRSVI